MSFTVEDIGRKVENPFYGGLYYIFMYDKAEKESRAEGLEDRRSDHRGTYGPLRTQ